MSGVHAVFAADRDFAAPLSVAVHSLAGTNPGSRVTILHSGFDAHLRDQIAGDSVSELALSWCDVREDLRGVSNTIYLPPAALFRLLMDEFVPSAGTVIYIDCDTLIVDDLTPLLEETAAEPVAAVADANAPFAAGPGGTHWRELGLPPDMPYFNSGVMAVNLAAWRRERIGERAIELLRWHTLRWGDQCALNAVLAGQWRPLARRWNLQTADASGQGLAWVWDRGDVERALERPAIVHFTERDKPWLGESRHPYASLWHERCGQTPFAGWRPAPHRIQTVVKRVRRATRLAKG